MAGETLTLGLTLIAGGITPIIGLVIVDTRVNKVDWAAPGTWLWLGTFVILFLAGVGLTLLSRKKAVSPAAITADVR